MLHRCFRPVGPCSAPTGPAGSPVRGTAACTVWHTLLPSLGAPADEGHRGGRALQAQWGVENNRALPEWGRAVLSDLCIMMTPAGEAELTAFVKYTIALAHAYMEVARHVQPPASNLCACCSRPLLACFTRPVHFRLPPVVQACMGDDALLWQRPTASRTACQWLLGLPCAVGADALCFRATKYAHMADCSPCPLSPSKCAPLQVGTVCCEQAVS